VSAKQARACCADRPTGIVHATKFHVTCPIHHSPAAHGVLVTANSNSTEKSAQLSSEENVFPPPNPSTVPDEGPAVGETVN
jgi:hypothetical protein